MWFFTEWAELRKERARRRSYEDGFAWAMTSHYLEGLSYRHINLMSDHALHPFDRGAQEALGIIARDKKKPANQKVYGSKE